MRPDRRELRCFRQECKLTIVRHWMPETWKNLPKTAAADHVVVIADASRRATRLQTPFAGLGKFLEGSGILIIGRSPYPDRRQARAVQE